MNSHAPEAFFAPVGMTKSSPPSKVEYLPVGPGSGAIPTSLMIPAFWIAG